MSKHFSDIVGIDEANSSPDANIGLLVEAVDSIFNVELVQLQAAIPEVFLVEELDHIIQAQNDPSALSYVVGNCALDSEEVTLRPVARDGTDLELRYVCS